MVASPTLNVIVLTMLFSILPFYMAVMKIALSLFVILLAVPILCRFLPARELQVADACAAACPTRQRRRRARTPCRPCCASCSITGKISGSSSGPRCR
jgi:uncharacterized membrane protein YraQ (UPF0718 family)